MAFAPSTNTAIADRSSILLFLVLIAAGLAGNYFSYPIFPDVEFLFGGIFAMLALQFGIGRGILAAAIIASYTYFLWNKPGVLFAINCKSGLQIIPGFSIPIGIDPSEGEFGAPVYLSFEHPLF